MRVTVLMPLLNGARFLDAQLDSLAAQTLPPDCLLVSDDGSGDASPAIVRDFARRAPFAVTVVQGPGQGYAANALSLVARAPAGTLAFCDQDDIWLPDRMARGMAALRHVDEPALHVTRRIVTRADPPRPPPLPWRGAGRRLGALLGQDRPDRGRPAWPVRATSAATRAGTEGFAAALVQNLAPANATLINPAAAALAQSSLACLAPGPAPPFPDWWLFALALGSGGQVLFDDRPGVFYRQHDHNLLGAASGLAGRARRLRQLADGTYGQWLRDHAGALNLVRNHLTPAARNHLDLFRISLDGKGRMPRGCSRNAVAEQALILIARRFNRI